MLRVLRRAPWIAVGAVAAWLLGHGRGAAVAQAFKERANAWLGGDPVPWSGGPQVTSVPDHSPTAANPAA